MLDWSYDRLPEPERVVLRRLCEQTPNRLRLFGFAKARPCFHQLAALLQRIAAAVCLFGLVPDDMRQRECRLLAEGQALACGGISPPCPQSRRLESSAIASPEQRQRFL
jgi:hypothetical protein